MPPNTLDFYRNQLTQQIRREHLSNAKAKSLAERYAKLIGMTVGESGGDVTTVTLYTGKQTKPHFVGPNPECSIGGLDRNLKNFLGSSNYQTNFGLLQMSPDVAIYGNDQDVASLLHDFQKKIRADKHEALKRCGSKFLYSDTDEALADALSQVATCEPILHVVMPQKGSPVIDQDKGRIGCFARLVSLCPGLQIPWALDENKKYFKTRKRPPRCEDQLRAAVKDYFSSASEKPVPTPKDNPKPTHGDLPEKNAGGLQPFLSDEEKANTTTTATAPHY